MQSYLNFIRKMASWRNKCPGQFSHEIFLISLLTLKIANVNMQKISKVKWEEVVSPVRSWWIPSSTLEFLPGNINWFSSQQECGMRLNIGKPDLLLLLLLLNHVALPELKWVRISIISCCFHKDFITWTWQLALASSLVNNISVWNRLFSPPFNKIRGKNQAKLLFFPLVSFEVKVSAIDSLISVKWRFICFACF